MTGLGIMRTFIQNHAINGDRVIWGSHDVVRISPTVKELEDLALEIALAELRTLYNSVNRAPAPEDPRKDPESLPGINAAPPSEDQLREIEELRAELERANRRIQHLTDQVIDLKLYKSAEQES